jgi:hypothetical protein
MTDRELIAAMTTELVSSGYARNRMMSERPTDAQIASKALTLALGILEAVDARAYERPEPTSTGSRHLSDDEWLAKIRKTRQEIWGDEPTAQPGARPL